MGDEVCLENEQVAQRIMKLCRNAGFECIKVGHPNKDNGYAWVASTKDDKDSIEIRSVECIRENYSIVSHNSLGKVLCITPITLEHGIPEMVALMRA